MSEFSPKVQRVIDEVVREAGVEAIEANPIGRRIGFVEQNFEPEVAEFVLETLDEAVEDASIDPEATLPWEHLVPQFASNANRAFRAYRRGRISDGELQVGLDNVREEIFQTIAAYERVASFGPALTPREVRQRVESGVDMRGAEFVTDLGEGYTAVVATPDLDAPAFPRGDTDEPSPKMKEWVERYAPFQQYMGVSMGNCLQFYRVNYVSYGGGKFEMQQAGGKLYAVLDSKGRPVAATLTDAHGTVIETNGIGNSPPRGADAKALERFEAIMGWDALSRGVFDVPGVSRAIESAVEWALDDVAAAGPVRTEFIERATAAARQDGFDGDRVAKAWGVYVLVDSPYSARASVLSTDYPQRQEVAAVIDEATEALIARDEERIDAARIAADVAADVARAAAREGNRAASETARAAQYAATAAANATSWAPIAAGQARGGGDGMGYTAWYAARAAARVAGAADAAPAEVDYAAALLRLMEAEAAGELRPVAQANPRRRKPKPRKAATGRKRRRTR